MDGGEAWVLGEFCRQRPANAAPRADDDRLGLVRETVHAGSVGIFILVRSRVVGCRKLILAPPSGAAGEGSIVAGWVSGNQLVCVQDCRAQKPSAFRPRLRGCTETKNYCRRSIDHSAGRCLRRCRHVLKTLLYL